jgi:3',5'-cyclic AMP phosphodiesterase CpdA
VSHRGGQTVAVLAPAILAVLLWSALAAAADPPRQAGKTLRIVHVTDIHAACVDHNPPPRFAGDPLCNDLVRSLPILRATVDHINQHVHPDAVVITGDLVDRGTDLASLREVKVCLDRLTCRYYPVIGDHDRREVYEQVFPGRLNYSFECGPWHFVALDCNRGRLEPDALQWLRGDLSAARGRQTVVMLHRPLACDGLVELLGKSIYGTKLTLENAAETRTLLRGFGQVKLVLGGHIHAASDLTIQGIRYLTTPALVVGPHMLRVLELSGERITTTLVPVPMPPRAPKDR